MARKSRKNADVDNAAAVVGTALFRVGAYVRMSVEDRKQKGNSIENQQAIVNAYIEENTDLELAEIYIDNGLSGQYFDRPDFTRMIADMESGKINCCITKDLSRLGRNAIDTGFYIEKFFPTKGIRYIAVTDNYDSADPRSGGVMISLKNMINEAYALETGRKVRQTKHMNALNGKFNGRIAPYGYFKSENDRHKLVVDPYASGIVRDIFEMAAERKSVTDILDRLNTSSICPPKRYFHSIGLATDKDIEGKHIRWSKSAIYAILNNRVYCGDMVQGKFKASGNVQKSVPKSEWIIVEDTHEGIVSRDLFDRVQALWTDSPTRNRTSFNENIFLRKVFCGHCGYALKRRRSGKKEDNYRFACSTRSVYSKDDCVPVSINEKELKGALMELLGKQTEVMGIEGNGVNQTRRSEQQSAYKASLRELQAEINRSNHLIKTLYESLMTQDITQDEYRELKTGYEAKIIELTAKEKDLRNIMVEQTALESATANAATHLLGIRHIDDLTSESLDRFVERILVFEDKHIEVHFKFAVGLVSSTSVDAEGDEQK